MTVPGYGFPLHNRGGLFSLDPSTPNIVAPRKRPFHTIIPAFVMKDGKPLLAFGNMGGAMQAAGPGDRARQHDRPRDERAGGG